jgi:tRNA (mo5U34)-methyltransferase
MRALNEDNEIRKAMPMDLAQQQARIDALTWYHEFDFGNGLQARSTIPEVAIHRPIWRFIERQLDAIDFRGKSVLDIGCWDGYWSFYAERRGASRVLAIDDASQNWSDGRGLQLAKELYRSNVEIDRHVSVYDLEPLGRSFDIILFLGVYYHLLDPFLALAQIRRRCHAGSQVLIEGNAAVGLPAKSALFDLDARTCKFAPTVEAFKELLRAAYFSVAAEQFMEAAELERPGWGWRLRLCAQALLGSRTGVVEMTRPLLALRRVFLVCTPMTGNNAAHYYKPPFGLHVFDGRFDEGK